jgi:hypothetical protein
MTGPNVLAMPKTEMTIPCCRRGKMSSRMVWPSGNRGAPVAPCIARQKTSASSDWERPHISVEIEKAVRLQNWTLPRPNRLTSQPVIGVHTAVARMLKVIVQAISSCVAAIAPCICGRMAVAVNVAAL